MSEIRGFVTSRTQKRVGILGAWRKSEPDGRFDANDRELGHHVLKRPFMPGCFWRGTRLKMGRLRWGRGRLATWKRPGSRKSAPHFRLGLPDQVWKRNHRRAEEGHLRSAVSEGKGGHGARWGGETLAISSASQLKHFIRDFTDRKTPPRSALQGRFFHGGPSGRPHKVDNDRR